MWDSKDKKMGYKRNEVRGIKGEMWDVKGMKCGILKV